MLSNYLKTSLRLLGRNKSFSLLNIFGLAIGIASSLLILLWVQYEYNYDHFAANHESIYQVKVNFTYNGTINTSEDNCTPAYLALRETDPRITNTCITSNTYGHSIDFRDKKSGKEVMAVSREFLDMFGIPLLKGNARALDEPYSILLNASTAKELFSDLDPIGQYVVYDHIAELKVTGIFEDVPRNSSFWFHALVPVYDYTKKNDWFLGDKDKWDSFYPRVYAQVQPGAPIDEINANIKDLVRKHVNDGSNPELFLHAMDRWHLYENFVNGKEAGGKIEYVRLFLGIALLILLIACINYMNMATARSARRIKEVGIRKSIGSSRPELIKQFLSESFFIAGMAYVLAIIMVQLALPDYNLLVHARLSLDFTAIPFWLFSAALIAITSLLSGVYPAFYFSSFQPAHVLKGTIRIGRDAGLPRKITVASQFIIALLLINGVVIIYEQIQHVKNRDLGFEGENLLMYAMNVQIEKNYAAIKQELLNSGVVESVTKSNEGIDVDYFTDYVTWSGMKTSDKIQFSRVSTDYDFIKTNGIRLLAGRDFSPDFRSDTAAALVNKTAVTIMGMQNPIGEKITIKDRELTIIGVFEDVVRGSPFDPVAPCFVGMLGDGNNHLTVRLSGTDNLTETLPRVDAIFKKLDPMNIDEPMFVTDRLTDDYQSINLVSRLANLFAFLGIFLTALGVLGLAAYTAEQRTKELAIRKVLGANLSSLLWLLSDYFVRIVLVAFVIAAPISLWASDNYLQDFSYRIDTPWQTLPLTAVVMVVLTLVIVSTQVFRAARANPVNSLRSE